MQVQATALAALMMVASLGAGQLVEYADDTTTLQGYLAMPGGKQEVPGVLIAHAWKGIQPHERQTADKLAEMGYAAFVVDIYGKGVRPETNQEAGRLAGRFKSDREMLRSRAMAGLKKLRSFDRVAQNRIVAIGFCFGGTTVIELGRAGAELAGIVSFHGGLDSPEPEAGKNITAPVLILHGADDPTVKQADIEAMLDEFNKADVAWTLVAFSDAVHAFTDPAAGKDPSQGAAYNKRAAVESWKIFTMYLERWTR